GARRRAHGHAAGRPASTLRRVRGDVPERRRRDRALLRDARQGRRGAARVSHPAQPGPREQPPIGGCFSRWYPDAPRATRSRDMADVEGIVVELETGNQSWAGTDDQLFVGVVGTQGGREFNLNVSGFNDFEPGTKVNYKIGKEFALALSGPEKTPITAPASLLD